MRPLQIGVLRPNMVMLEQTHPQEKEIAQLMNADVSKKPDLLLVLGTSLTVKGAQESLCLFSRSVRQQKGRIIFVNKSPPPSRCRTLIDYWVQWDTDAWVRYLKTRQPYLAVGARKGHVRKGRRRAQRRAVDMGGMEVAQGLLGSWDNPIILD